MIYRNNYFRKELRQAYTGNQISNQRKIAMALFAGLLSFGVYFVLQTMTESVLADAFPHIMQTSYFSTIYIYITVAFILNVINYIIFYDYLSFAEIQKNRWYLLEKMGYQPIQMIFLKLIASYFSLFIFYTSGFIFTIFFTFFLKFNFVSAYFPSLYVVGLVDLIVIETISMTGSLYIKNASTVRYFIIFSAILLAIARVALGYYNLVSDRILMQDFKVLFDFRKSVYLPLVAAVILICLAICFLRARSIAKYYSLPHDAFGYVIPENVTVVQMDNRTGKISLLNNTDQSQRRGRIFDIVTTVFLVFFIITALAFNIFIILISSAQPGKEVTIRGIIPYVFKSNTMEPAIMENDLAYFKHIDTMAKINVGDIVLFQENKIVYVERVKSANENVYKVDIDYYPPMAQKGKMIRQVERKAIYGVFAGRNRWLGGLILYANTILGRLTFLLIPAFLLFFYKPLRAFFAKNAKGYLEE